MRFLLLIMLAGFVGCHAVPTETEPKAADLETIEDVKPALEASVQPAHIAPAGEGEVLVTAYPRFRETEIGCEILMTEEGDTFPNVHTVLCFEAGDRTLLAYWSSRTTRAPVPLDAARRYRFLLRSLRGNEFYRVTRVWDGETLIYRAPAD